jgi:hypothetical protein
MQTSALLTRGGRALLTAVCLNASLFFVGNLLGIMSDEIIVPQANNGPITVIGVLVASILPTLIAILFFWALDRFTQHGSRIFQIIALSLLVASFYSPFAIPNVPISFSIWLNLMHVVVAGSLVYFLTMWKKAA